MQTIYEDWQDYEGGWDYLEEGNTNFTYLYADESTKKVTTNKAEYANYADVKQYQKQRGMEHSTMAITYASRKKKIILAA